LLLVLVVLVLAQHPPQRVLMVQSVLVWHILLLVVEEVENIRAELDVLVDQEEVVVQMAELVVLVILHQ
jgi:hypothetical protein